MRIKVKDVCISATLKRGHLYGISFHLNKKGTKEIILWTTRRQWLAMAKEIKDTFERGE
jgi:hypothetical protein